MSEAGKAKVFLDYDRESLDREYFIRGRVTEWDARIARFQEWSARRRADGPCDLDIAYGARKRHRLDIFPPVGGAEGTDGAGEAGAPVLIFIHGGYWRMLDKDDFSYIACGLEAHGALSVVVRYGRWPGQDMAGMVADVRDAIRWVGRRIADWGGDPRRVFVCGHSAGAQLAAQATTARAALPDGLLKGFIGISGVYDLRPVRACFLNDGGFLTPAEVRRYGANATRPASRRCPGLFVYGGLEGGEFERQSREQAAIWRLSGSPAKLLELPGLDHATTVGQLYRSKSELCQRIRGLMSGAG